jgi:hypothetical protein
MAAAATGPMRLVEEAEALAGRGLAGDGMQPRRARSHRPVAAEAVTT